MLAALRSVFSVLIGYVVFAASAFSIFQISGQKAHEQASLTFMVLSTIGGMCFALAGGYIAGWLAGRRPFAHGLAVACVLAAGAGASLASTLGHGAIWSQITALALMAPSAALGGRLRERVARAG